MGTALIVIMSILVYAFCARIVYNVYASKRCGYDKEEDVAYSTFFIITVPVSLILMSLKLPFKLADFATNSDNYKFSIEIKRKES